MNNDNIIKTFTAKNTQNWSSRQKALSIRDGKLYSYNLLIAEYISRPEEGFIGLLIHDHTATGLGFVSMTTSQHIGLLKRATTYHPRRVRALNESDSIFA